MGGALNWSIYTSTIGNPVKYDQFGVEFGAGGLGQAFTGSNGDGTPRSGQWLGNDGNGTGAGSAQRAGSAWIIDGVNVGSLLPIYALSSPITIPEPTTCALALAALCLVVGRRRSANVLGG